MFDSQYGDRHDGPLAASNPRGPDQNHPEPARPGPQEPRGPVEVPEPGVVDVPEPGVGKVSERLA